MPDEDPVRRGTEDERPDPGGLSSDAPLTEAIADGAPPAVEEAPPPPPSSAIEADGIDSMYRGTRGDETGVISAAPPRAGDSAAIESDATAGYVPQRWSIGPELQAAPPPDPYADVPAALELSFSNADLGLSPRAFERAFPYEGTAQRKRRAGRARARRVGRELVETLLLAVLIFFAVKAVVQNFRVEGRSMEPSLQDSQYLLVNKAIYYRFDTHALHKFLPFIPDSDGTKRHLFRAPRRGDVIVFKFPLDTNRDFIKRVIGVPGDTVEVKDHKVYINGNPLDEPYELQAPTYTYAPKTVPPGQYFVLGDNRNNSYDSHAWQAACSNQQTCDFVPEEDIIGQAWVTYWPFDELGFVNNKSLKPSAP